MRVGDIRMYYEVHGHGEPLLLITGLGGHSLDWGWLLPEMLAEHYQVVIYDNRGAGRSDQPQGPYSIKQMAQDTVGLMDAIGLKRSHIFGVSMGGMIAQEVALDYPERVEKLVLGCTMAGGASQVEPAPEVEAYLHPRSDLSILGAMWWSAPAGYSPEFICAHPEIVERKIQVNLAYPSRLDAYEAQLSAFKAYDSHARLQSIKADTLVLTGERDILIPPENSRILAERIPGARRQVIDGAGHLFWISHPEETFEAVRAFLG